MKVLIRKASDEDVATVDCVINQAFHWGGVGDRGETILKAVSDKNGQLLVAEVQGKVVGVIHQVFFCDLLNGGMNSYIGMLVVEERHRNQGIGSRLVEGAIEAAKQKGVVEVRLDVLKDKEDAIRFYRKHGFQSEETINFFRGP